MNAVKHTLLILAIAITSLHTAANEIPPMPDLERAIADNALVTRSDLKRQNMEMEIELIIEAYMRIEGLTEEETRKKHAGYLSTVESAVGGVYKNELRNAFYDQLKEDHPDPNYRLVKLFRRLNIDKRNPVLIAKIRQCVDEMEQRGDSPWRVAAGSLSYHDKYRYLVDSGEPTDEVDRYVFEHVAKLSTGPLTSSNRWRIWDVFLDDLITSKSPARRALALEIFENTQGVDPWVLAMVRGEYERTEAWAIRGSGFSNTVDADEYMGFKEHLKLSMKWFNEAYELDPMCPAGPSKMLSALYPNGDLWDSQGYVWVERTLVACIDYTDMLSTLRHLLSHKWHGDWDTQREAALWFNKPELYHTRLPYEAVAFLEDIMYNYGKSSAGVEQFWKSEGELIDSVIQTLEGMLATDSPAISIDYMHTLLAYLHYKRSGNLVESNRHIRACTKGLRTGAMAKLRWDDFRLESKVIPYVGPTADLAAAADQYESIQNYQKSIDKWNMVLAIFNSSDDEFGQRSARDHIQRIRWKEQYESGRWVKLESDQHMSGWWTHEGVWSPTDQNAIKLEQDFAENETLLIADLQPGNSFEYSADVQYIGEPGYNSTFALVFYRGHRSTDGYDMHRTVSVRPVKRKEGSIGWGYARTDYHKPIDIPDDYKFHLRVVVQGDQVAGYVNGVLIGKGDVPNYHPEKEPEINRIGIGSWAPGRKGHALFTNIKIRKYTPSDPLDF